MKTAAELTAEYFATGTLAGLPSGHFIDGDFVQPSHNRTLESFDPGRGEAFARLKEHMQDCPRHALPFSIPPGAIGLLAFSGGGASRKQELA